MAAIRDDRSRKCRELWHEEALCTPDQEILLLPLPSSNGKKLIETEASLRVELFKAQAKDAF